MTTPTTEAKERSYRLRSFASAAKHGFRDPTVVFVNGLVGNLSPEMVGELFGEALVDPDGP
jgi:hypothetical protein